MLTVGILKRVTTTQGSSARSQALGIGGAPSNWGFDPSKRVLRSDCQILEWKKTAMALDRVPDMSPRAAEIDDPRLLVQRLLYRQGRIALMFDGEDFRSAGERERYVRSVTEANKADLRRLEELVDAGPPLADRPR